MILSPKTLQWIATGFFLGFISFRFFKLLKDRTLKFHRDFKFVLIVRSNLSVAETAELCSQVTLECYRSAMILTPEFVSAWERNSQPKITLKLDKNYESEAQALREKARGLGLVAVGLKEKLGCLSVVGIGPGPKELIDQVTGHLKLLG